jgi:hypothetical protein
VAGRCSNHTEPPRPVTVSPMAIYPCHVLCRAQCVRLPSKGSRAWSRLSVAQCGADQGTEHHRPDKFDHCHSAHQADERGTHTSLNGGGEPVVPRPPAPQEGAGQHCRQGQINGDHRRRIDDPEPNEGSRVLWGKIALEAS